MVIDFSQPILNLAGKPIKEQNQDGAEETLTLATLCVSALMGSWKGDEIAEPNVPMAKVGEEKARRCALAVMLYDAHEVTLKSEDIVLLKKLIGIAFPQLYVGRAYELLENEKHRKVDRGAKG